jgi:hypothetical protein
MKHLGSSLLLGVLLAMMLMLVYWVRIPHQGGVPGKAPFHRTLDQLDLIDDDGRH